MPESSGNLVYAYQDWEVDLSRRELRSRGIPVLLGSRAFEIVTILVQSAAGFVSNDHLMDRVWPGITVGEGTIRVHISAVRKALGPDRNLLKTSAGRGYHLLGSWTPRRREDAAAPIEYLQRAPPRARHRTIFLFSSPLWSAGTRLRNSCETSSPPTGW